MFEFGYSIRFLMSLIVTRPFKNPPSSMIGSFSILFLCIISPALSSEIPLVAVMSGIGVIASEASIRMFFSNRISRFVRIPKSLLCPSTTGTPEILYSFMSFSASSRLASG